MPARNTTLSFENHHKQLPVPFVVYADFEGFTKPINTCHPNANDSYTYNYQKHEPSGFCLYLQGLDGINQLFNAIIHTKQSDDEDIASIFVSKLEGKTHKIYNDYYRKPHSLKLTKKEKKNLNPPKICHIWHQDLRQPPHLQTAGRFRGGGGGGARPPPPPVIDHCHFTGKYRGAAHNSCNLQCRKPMVLPVIFHNLQGYDANLFIKQLAKLKDGLTCIPSTEEKYISFSKKIKVGECKSRKTGETVSLNFEIRFIDSFKFLQTLLANLVSHLQPSDFKNNINN